MRRGGGGPAQLGGGGRAGCWGQLGQGEARFKRLRNEAGTRRARNKEVRRGVAVPPPLPELEREAIPAPGV